MHPAHQAGATGQPAGQTYFFLSYAHLSPLQGLATDPDLEVRKFFDDLSEQLRPLVGAGPEDRVGFLDTELRPGTDWNEARTLALSAAHVFVPLYSATYFRNAWTQSELESFRARLKAVPVQGAHRHILPVLWDPLPPWEQRREIAAALAVAPDIEAYQKDGLRALSRFSMYRDEYSNVLARIAVEIADVATRRPLPLSPAPPPAPEPIPRDQAQFVVVVAALVREEVSSGADVEDYTDDATQWRPFHDADALPAAEYAASSAERLNLATYVTDVPAVGNLLDTRPAVLLIDPWYLDGAGQDRELAGVLRGLPPWAIPVIAFDAADRRTADQGARLAGRVEDLLQQMDRPPARQLRGLAEFVSDMPRLISEARRQYLKNAPMYPSHQIPSPRLRLLTGEQPSEPTFWERVDDHGS